MKLKIMRHHGDGHKIQFTSPAKESKSETSCSCCSNSAPSFEKKSSKHVKESFITRHKEFFVILLRIVLTGIAYVAVGQVIKQFGHEAAGFVHDHSYIGFASEVIHIWGWDLPIVVLYFIPYLIIGYDILLRSVKNISHGEVFDENFLMGIATIGALILGEYGEAIAVMVFYQIGEMFQDLAVQRSKQSITDLMDIRPDYANVEKDGTLVQVDPVTVAIGTIIIVKPGEKIPLDGVLLEGSGTLDTSALTGESFPRVVTKDDEVLSGCLNLTTVLRIRVTKPFGESTVSKILKLVEHSSAKKAHVERFISRFAKLYTPAVVIGATLLAILPPLLLGGEWITWIQRSLILLVISCPCALVISVPLGFFAGIGCSSKHGILIKGGSYLEALSRVKTVVFDKTGTLTRGVFTVTAVHVIPHAEQHSDEKKEVELLEITALAERYSNHPISISIKNELYERTKKNVLDSEYEKRIKDVQEIAGKGVCSNVDGKTVLVGNARLMDDSHIKWDACTEFGTIIHIAIDGAYAGHIVIADEAKPEARESIRALNELGVVRTLMLTGDSKETGEHIGNQIGLDEVHAELLPSDKVSHVEALLAERSQKNEQKNKKGISSSTEMLAFVGDGINDAPVLALADVGIAMGSLGSDAAIEAADIVLMDDNPQKISLAMRISRRTLSIVKQNIVFALGIKALVLVLGAMGLANMWMAIFADTGVALLAVLNAMRALRLK